VPFVTTHLRKSQVKVGAAIGFSLRAMAELDQMVSSRSAT
jgi:hypothetical protein